MIILGTAFVSDESIGDLRKLYSRPLSEWPKPTLDPGVVHAEFKPLPKLDSSYFALMRSPKVTLGKMLFFDPMLSGSNQISCSSCHNPQTSWADHQTVPVGNDHLVGTRNAISLLNVYARKTFFWDGRAKSLQEQAIAPIEAHNEMAMDQVALPKKLAKIKAYQDLFLQAYGTKEITMHKITQSLTDFQLTLTSRRSRFDEFLDGKYTALTDQEITGMHLFRTKARCMNCHSGQFFTDEEFHNIGLTYYKRKKYEDWGRYHVTKDPADIGKFRTPSLRDVMNTAPWMHNGLFDSMIGVINMYNSGMHMIDPTPEKKALDPNYPFTDPLLKKLELTATEIRDIEAFLQAITATKYRMDRPEKLPR